MRDAAPRARRAPGLQARRHLRRRVRDAAPPTCTRPTRTSARPQPTDRKKIMILGGGPNRIGQGIEFDYCCVHAAFALREDGFETIMVNCNPETVSTDYDTSDRLYFEPLTLEDVLEIVDMEKPLGRDRAVRRPDAAEARARPRGERRADHRHLARHRSTSPRTASASSSCCSKLGLQQPPNRTARTEDEALRAGAARSAIRWWCARATCSAAARWRSCTSDARPRALHARGGQGLATTRRCCSTASSNDAIEVDVDCVARRRATCMIGGVMEHIEEAGVHSGDSACSLPPYSLSHETAGRAASARPSLMAQGAERRRPDERAVRDPERRGRRGRRLRARSQPARLAHRAVRVQGDRHAAGEDRRALHGRARRWRSRASTRRDRAAATTR